MRDVRIAVALGALIVAACGGAEKAPHTVRLVDLFGDATVGESLRIEAPVRPVRWSFDDPGAGDAWRGVGVDGLKAQEGFLSGRTTDAESILHAERTTAVNGDDLLHAVEIGMRVSEGGELSVRFDGDEEADVQRALNDVFPWQLHTALVPGGEVQRYTIRPSRPINLSRTRHILIRPTDVAGASFEIEFVRIVSRHEHLASIDSGVGWHGMDNVFQETIVTRSPQTVSFTLTVPELRPRLDVSLATIEDGAAKFRIEARSEDGQALTLERTVSRAHRWNRARLVLDPLAGREVTLSLSLASERKGFLGFWGGAAVRSARPSSGPAGAPQGVIVLLADTLRADHLDALGYARETAPVLAALAADGALAADSVSQATWTKVSVPSIFTSLYPSTHTVAQFTDRLPASAVTMAEVFREAGYATLALTSISFTGQFTNLHQGYEELHESASLRDSSNSKTAREYMDRLLPWLDAHRDVPFFVFLHVADPHSPYRAYAPFDTMWGETEDYQRLDEYTEMVRAKIENPVMRRFGMPTRSELASVGIDADEYVGYEIDAYDGSIRAMDVEVGRLLERLHELGLADRTLLAFVSDHGTEFLDHDEHFHGHSVYGELNRVPMFVWGPGRVPSGVVLEPTVQTIDLMPTLLELAGLEAPPGIQGASLAPLMRAAARDEEQRWPRVAITEKARLEDGDLPGRGHASIALIEGGWKLVRNRPAPDGINEFELYDHREDPLNLKDVAAQHPDRVTRLAELLETWETRALSDRLDGAEAEAGLDDVELERLRSLGYLR